MFVKTTGPKTAEIMLVGEAPGEEENRVGKPFVGFAGKTLDKLLMQAGTSKAECLVANVAREEPPGNKMAFYYEDKKMTKPKQILQDWIEYLKSEIEMYRPNIVIALGRHALFALTGELGIRDKRGYIMESSLVKGQKVLGTYHPQKVNYEWNLHFTVVMDLRKAVANSNSNELPRDDRILRYTPSLREFKDYLKYLLEEPERPIAVDIETTQPGSHIDIIGIAESPLVGMSYTFIKNRTPVLSPETEKELWLLLEKVLRIKPTIWQNGKYDTTVLLHNNGIFCKNYNFDTHIAMHCCFPETPRSLAYMASIFLNVSAWKHTASSHPAQYNCADAVNTYGIYEILNYKLDELGARKTFEHEMSQIFPSAMLEMRGLFMNKEKQKSLIEENKLILQELKEELNEKLGRPIIFKANEGEGVNINSSKQLQSLLYVDLGLQAQYKRGTRKLTVEADALRKLERKTKNPILSLILKAKEYHTITNRFLDVETSPASRVHTCYNVTGATMLRPKKGFIVDDDSEHKSFGRWSSSKSIIFPYGSGNLQNIPYPARKLYTAPKGYEFLQADYMQAEAVVVAYLIGDRRLIKLFQYSFGLSREERDRRGLDVHRLTAHIMFGIPIEDITSDQRGTGKTIRHATNYNAGPTVIMNKLGCKMAEAKKLLKLYYNSTPQLGMWQKRIQAELRRTRTLTNLLGRKHKFISRWGDTLFRSAYAFIPQSTVGDLLNLSLVRFYKLYGKEIQIVLQLHDAIYIMSRLEEREENMKKLKSCMHHPLEVNGEEFVIDVDFSAGPSWGELEEL